jgi:phytoene dehydrogenase-like protein
MIERFFRPFLGGVFLERPLDTSVRKLEFVMRHFALGETAIPALGMAEIPRQLASALPPAVIRLNTRVVEIGDGGVRLDNGAFVSAKTVVVATDLRNANKLLGRENPPLLNQGVACLYFSAPVAPVKEPILLLNGEGTGPVNNLTVLSAVSPDYAPPGRHLISISVVDPAAAAAPDLEEMVRQQVTGWFGAQVNDWSLLRLDRIPDALPSQKVVDDKPARIGPGLYQCGDHCGIASINSAFATGTAAADAILTDLG